MRRSLAALAVVLALAAPAGAAERSPARAASPTRLELEVLAAINDARAQNGLRPLRLAPRLESDAQDYAASLMARNLFVHSGAPGVGEVMAWGTGKAMGPREIVALWMNSPPHRTLLLWKQARRAGVGLAFGRFQGYDGVRLAVARFAL
jgi:uncharacterized protein YkwD